MRFSLDPVHVTMFGAGIVDHDLEKMSWSLGEYAPELVGAAAGGGLGYLGSRTLTDPEDPQARTKRVLATLLGMGAGAGFGRLYKNRTGKSESSPEQRSPESTAAEPSVPGKGIETSEPPPAAASSSPQRLEGSPMGGRPSLARRTSVSGRHGVTAAQSEQRLQSTQQQLQQRAQQQMQQATMQQASATERANLLKDQARIQTRLQHLLAPSQAAVPGQGPRNFVVGPGGQQVYARGTGPGLPMMPPMVRTAELSKTAQSAVSQIQEWVQNNPEAVAGALAGGGVGAVHGWGAPGRSSDRKRKMISDMLIGSLLGGAGGTALSRLRDQASALNATRANTDRLLSGAADLVGNLNQGAGAIGRLGAQ